MKYGNCVNHPNTYAVNARQLCIVCTKEKHERSTESKEMTIKKKDNGNDRFKSSTTSEGSVGEGNFSSQLPIQVQKSNHFKKTKIKSISKDKSIELSTLAEIKKRKISIQGKNCELCGKSGEVDLFHIIGVGNKKHSTDENNLLLSCRFCHLVWGANDWSKIQRFINYENILERLKNLDEGKYWKFIHRVENFKND